MTEVVKEKSIPPNILLAAKRAFIRTTSQAYATAIAGGISTTAILSLMAGEASWVEYIITWVVALLSPLLAGLASYLNMISDGIPEAYTGKVVTEQDRSYIPKHGQ